MVLQNVLSIGDWSGRRWVQTSSPTLSCDQPNCDQNEDRGEDVNNNNKKKRTNMVSH